MASSTTTTTTTSSKSTPSDDVLSERHLRKRLAARVRQQRCRARKREAKMAKAHRDVKTPRPSMLHHQVVRGPVLIRSPPRMSMPLFHHPTSPFIMYPRRAATFPPPPPPPLSVPARQANRLWHQQPLPPAPAPHSPPIATISPPITSIPHFHGSGSSSRRPLHQEIMTGSALALGICQSPPTSHHVLSPPRHLHIPRVSPVAENFSNNKMMPPLMPELDRLERNEEAAIDAMLSLGRSSSKSTQSSTLVQVHNY